MSHLAAPLREYILIVDDSPDNLRVLSATLSRSGYEVRCAKNGLMALNLTETAKPDLILLDIRMPGLDGYEVCQRLKINPQTANIPIIFLSALDDALDKVKAFGIGGADYITKPFQLEEVLARVKHQLAIYGLQKELAQQNARLQQEIINHQKTEATLLQEIHHRTLIESALRDAKETAETANYTKTKFLENMSHELRTPLNAVLGFAQLMRNDSNLSEEQQSYLSSIYQSGEDLLALINHLLAITGSAANQISCYETTFDLYRLLDLLYQTCQPQAIAKGLLFQLEYTPEVPQWVQSDEGKLQQILTTLVENAINVTETGTVTLQVHGKREGAIASALLFFDIENSGAEISPYELGILLEGPYQPESQQYSDAKSRVGLPLSYQLVKLIGGDISVNSISGKSSVFQLRIQVGLIHHDSMPDNEVSSQPEIREGEITHPELGPSPIDTLQSVEERMASQLQTLMPIDWISQLHWAAIRGFDQVILQLVQDIPTEQKLITSAIVEWTHNFEFDKIVHLTQFIVG